MRLGEALSRSLRLSRLLIAIWAALLAGCAGAKPGLSGDRDGQFVEIPNPAFTMSPNAPETIWVPRRYLDAAAPRGAEPAQGYQAAPAGVAPRAPEPALVEPSGKPAALLPHFGLVVALDRERVYFNLGKDAGINPGQKLKVYRGGTVVEGLGLAPGAQVATVEVVGFVGTQGAYGVIQQGGPVQQNDLIGAD